MNNTVNKISFSVKYQCINNWQTNSKILNKSVFLHTLLMRDVNCIYKVYFMQDFICLDGDTSVTNIYCCFFILFVLIMIFYPIQPSNHQFIAVRIKNEVHFRFLRRGKLNILYIWYKVWIIMIITELCRILLRFY